MGIILAIYDLRFTIKAFSFVILGGVKLGGILEAGIFCGEKWLTKFCGCGIMGVR